jgi:hypothetical protein
MQPYLDSDMQSRWFDFGGNTIVRTDKYEDAILGSGSCADLEWKIHTAYFGSTITRRVDLFSGASHGHELGGIYTPP